MNYSGAHVVANHAYSILGWSYVGGQEYQECGAAEPLGHVRGHAQRARGDMDGMGCALPRRLGVVAPLSLPTVDGVFAMRADTFKSHFAGFGVVKR